jgi:hypothetical protein
MSITIGSCPVVIRDEETIQQAREWLEVQERLTRERRETHQRFLLLSPRNDD